MKIFLITQTYPTIKNPYALTFVHTRAKIYKRFGNSVTVFVPCRYCNIKYTFEGIDVIKQPFNKLKKLISQYDADIIALHGPSGYWISYLFTEFSPKAWLRYISDIGIPIITWIHGSEALMRYKHHYFSPIITRDLFSKAISIPIDLIKLSLLKKVLSKVNVIVTISRWLKREIINTLHTSKPIYVIPNPIDTSLFAPRDIKPENINKGISIRALRWKYGMDIAVKAFSNFNKAILTIMGTGILKNYLFELAKKVNSSVSFIDTWVKHEELPKIMEQYGFFVAPSRTEGQGVTMCEAMSIGLPIVATKVGGIPEFVINNYNGLLVSPENPKAMREAINSLITDTDLFYRLSNNAKIFVRKHLSHKIIYQKEIQVFKIATSMI